MPPYFFAASRFSRAFPGVRRVRVLACHASIRGRRVLAPTGGEVGVDQPRQERVGAGRVRCLLQCVLEDAGGIGAASHEEEVEAAGDDHLAARSEVGGGGVQRSLLVAPWVQEESVVGLTMTWYRVSRVSSPGPTRTGT